MINNKVITKRLEYLDIMKGVAILLVLTNHVLREIAIQHPLDYYVSRYHMPFFFMLSGFLAINQIKKPLIRNISNKFKSLMLPFFTCGISFALTFNKLNEYIFNPYHAGYWFLFSLFTHWILFLFLKRILYIIKLDKYIIIEIAVLISPFFLGNIIMHFLNDITINTLTLSYTISYYRFFILGYFIGKFILHKQENNLQLISHPICFSTSVIIFIGTSLIYITRNNITTIIPPTVWQLLLCLSLFYILYNYKLFLPEQPKRLLIYLGRNTLIIYTFHYFFLYTFTSIECKHLSSYGLQVIIGAIIITIIVIACLGVSSLFTCNKILSFLFLGKNSNK